jgi:hypothetical protein
VKEYKTIIGFLGKIGVVLIVFLSMLNFNFLLSNQNNIKRVFLLYKPLFIEANKENVRIAHAVKKVTTQQAEIAVIGAGSIPYFSERQSIDILGKIDSYIAHLPNRIPSGGLANIRPGHMKWDYEHTFGYLEPDLILGIWGDREEAEIYIDGFYTAVVVNGEQFLARNDSPEILWDKVEQFPE